jgi:peroxiredoxin
MRLSILFLGAALASIGCGAGAPPPKTPSAVDAPGGSIAATPTIWVTPDLGSPHPGDAAPDFELVDQDGKTQRLSSYRGQLVVLTFMSGFCPFSRAEQPNLKKLAEDYAGKDVKVLDVLIQEGEADYATYMSSMPMPFPIMRDTTGQVGASYSPPKAIPEVKGVPVVSTSNLIIDREGKIRFFTLVDIKQFDEKLVHLRRALDKLLSEKGG